MENNFGLTITDPTTNNSQYNSFGVINSSLTGLSTIANTITDSVSPSAISNGNLVGQVTSVAGYLQSGNFKTGVSGWFIGADGTCEFSSGIFRGTITASSGTIGGWTIGATALTGGGVTLSSTGTITGATIQTASSGNRVVMNGPSNTLEFYYSGSKSGIMQPVSVSGGLGVQFTTGNGLASVYLSELSSVGYFQAVNSSGATFVLGGGFAYMQTSGSSAFVGVQSSTVTINGTLVINGVTYSPGGSQTPWTSNIDAAGYYLTGLGKFKLPVGTNLY